MRRIELDKVKEASFKIKDKCAQAGFRLNLIVSDICDPKRKEIRNQTLADASSNLPKWRIIAYYAIHTFCSTAKQAKLCLHSLSYALFDSACSFQYT